MSDCFICLDNKKYFQILHDNHRVCVDCYKRLQTPTCPFCRAPIKLHEVKVINNYKQNDYNINTQRIERRLKRNRRKNFESYEEYLQHRRKIKIRYKNAHLKKYSS